MHFCFKIMRSSVLCLYDGMYCKCYGKRCYKLCVDILSLQNPRLIIIRSYVADLELKLFYNCEVALPHISAFPLGLCFINIWIHTYAILAAHPNLQTTHEGNFCTCHCTLFSDYSDQSLTTRSLERKFSTSIQCRRYGGPGWEACDCLCLPPFWFT